MEDDGIFEGMAGWEVFIIIFLFAFGFLFGLPALIIHFSLVYDTWISVTSLIIWLIMFIFMSYFISKA